VTPPADGGDACSNLCSNKPNTTPPESRHPAESRIFARFSDTACGGATSPQLDAAAAAAGSRQGQVGPGVSRRLSRNGYGSCSSLCAQPAPTWKTGSETKKSCGLGSDGYQTVTNRVHNHRGTRVVLLGGSASCKIFVPPVNPGGVHREGTSAPPDTAGESGVGAPEGVRRGPRARRGGARSDPARHPSPSVTRTPTHRESRRACPP